LSVDKSVGRAEALRRAMLVMIDKGEPHEAHPAYWAPFVVVGEWWRRRKLMQKRKDGVPGDLGCCGATVPLPDCPLPRKSEPAAAVLTLYRNAIRQKCGMLIGI
jgi:CHAT domain